MKERIAEANERAQAAFHAMLEAEVYGLPDHPLTVAYEAAERYQDALIEAEQAHVEAVARMPRYEATGDHHIYPRGVGK